MESCRHIEHRIGLLKHCNSVQKCEAFYFLHRLAFGAGDGVGLADGLAFLAHGAGLLPLVGLLAAAAEQVRQHQHVLADALHHGEPRQSGRQRHRGQEQHQQEQVAAQPAEQLQQRLADQRTEDAAGTGRKMFRRHAAQVQQAGGGNQEAHHADQAQRRAEVGFAITVGIHAEQRDPGHRAQDQRQQESDVAEQPQQHVGQVGTGQSAHVVDRRRQAARLRPTGVLRRKREEAGQQIQQQRRDGDQRQIAPQALPARVRR